MLHVKNMGIFNRTVLMIATVAGILFCASFIALALEPPAEQSSEVDVTTNANATYADVLAEPGTDTISRMPLSQDPSNGVGKTVPTPTDGTFSIGDDGSVVTSDVDNADSTVPLNIIETNPMSRSELGVQASSATPMATVTNTFAVSLSVEREYINPQLKFTNAQVVHPDNSLSHYSNGEWSDPEYAQMMEESDRIGLSVYNKDNHSDVSAPFMQLNNWKLYFKIIGYNDAMPQNYNFDCAQARVDSWAYDQWMAYDPYSTYMAGDFNDRRFVVVGCDDVLDSNGVYVDSASRLTPLLYSPEIITNPLKMCFMQFYDNANTCMELSNGLSHDTPNEDRWNYVVNKSIENSYMGDFTSSTITSISPRRLMFEEETIGGHSFTDRLQIVNIQTVVGNDNGFNAFYLCDYDVYGAACAENSPGHSGVTEGCQIVFSGNTYVDNNCFIYVRQNTPPSDSAYWSNFEIDYTYTNTVATAINPNDNGSYTTNAHAQFGNVSVRVKADAIPSQPLPGPGALPDSVNPTPAPAPSAPASGGSYVPPTYNYTRSTVNSLPLVVPEDDTTTPTVDLSADNNANAKQSSVTAPISNNNGSGGNSASSGNWFMNFLHSVNWPLIGLFLSLALIVLCLVLLLARMGYRVSRESGKEATATA